MSDFHQAFIGAGSNLGDRAENIRHAVELLRAVDGIRNVKLSPLYETPPIGVTDQPVFVNAAIGLETTLEPEELLETLLETERKMGRVRKERWGPRLIDLDLVLYENETRETDSLTLPHPRFRERTFVTTPLRDLLALPQYNRHPWKNLAAELCIAPPDPTIHRLPE